MSKLSPEALAEVMAINKLLTQVADIVNDKPINQIESVIVTLLGNYLHNLADDDRLAATASISANALMFADTCECNCPACEHDTTRH